VGDIFEVRVAGNVVGPIELASVEYSAKFLGSSVIFVLGHENCGAVKAVLSGQTKDIEPVADKIIEALSGKNKSEISLENAIKANVRNVVNQIKSHGPISKLINEKKLEVVGGYYRLESGKVELCCD
jgi:carbonic anhydrase